MKQFAILAAFALALALPSNAQTSAWIPDQAHSEVQFSILHLAISDVNGHFGKITGNLVLDRTDMQKSKATFSIDVSSIDTGMSTRDSVLKSDSFFDIQKYPTATFVSTSVAKDGTGLKVAGNLTLRGVTRPVVLAVEGPNWSVSGPNHEKQADFVATAEIDRKDFGIGAAFPSSLVGDKAKLTIDLKMIVK